MVRCVLVCVAGKLRDIEILMQTYKGTDTTTVEAVLKIMYATDADFVALDESGNPITSPATAGPAGGMASPGSAAALPAPPAATHGDGNGDGF